MTGSGRTDAGVHAQGQVANVETIRTMDTDASVRGVNALLPPEIRVWQVEEVGPEFHSRRSAHSKTYEYRIWRQHIVSPFHCRYVYAFPYAMDAAAMDEASRLFHRNPRFHVVLCAPRPKSKIGSEPYFEAHWQRDSRRMDIPVRGNGFLQYMVRTIVGHVALCRDRESFLREDIPAIFEARDRRLAGPCVPACGASPDSC